MPRRNRKAVKENEASPNGSAAGCRPPLKNGKGRRLCTERPRASVASARNPSPRCRALARRDERRKLPQQLASQDHVAHAEVLIEHHASAILPTSMLPRSLPAPTRGQDWRWRPERLHPAGCHVAYGDAHTRHEVGGRARDSAAAQRGDVARTVTSWPPSEYSPSSRPVAIIESLIRMTLSAPKAANRRRIMDGWICTPSAISSGITSEWSNAAPMGPGLRWCSGGMALHRCVICRAPASMAAHAVS